MKAAMKKTYIIPTMDVEPTPIEVLLSTSRSVTAPDTEYDLGYGGVDEGGNIDPEVKGSSFDVEWE